MHVGTYHPILGNNTSKHNPWGLKCNILIKKNSMGFKMVKKSLFVTKILNEDYVFGKYTCH